MAHRRELILAAITAALTNSPDKPAGVTVHRYRTRPIDADKLPAVVVYPGPGKGGVGETVLRMDHDNNVERALSVRIEVRESGDPPDQILDPFLVWVTKVMRSDPTLGGLSRDIEEQSTSIDADEKDRVYAGAANDWLVTYATKEDNPEAPA